MDKSRDYEYDIYISYSHLDDETVSNEQPWITQFHQQLEYELIRLSGNKITIFRYHKLNDNEIFFDEIQNAINSSAIFLAFISPAYLQSNYCLQELDAFYQKAQKDEIGSFIEEHSRIFKVLLSEIPYKELPEIIQNTLGYNFYSIEQFDHVGDLLDQTSQQFNSQLKELAYDVHAILNQIKGRLNKEDAEDIERMDSLTNEFTQRLKERAKEVGFITREYFYKYLPKELQNNRHAVEEVFYRLDEMGIDLIEESEIEPRNKVETEDNIEQSQLINDLTNRNLAISTVATNDIESLIELMTKAKLPWHVGPPMQTGDLLLIYIPKGILKAIKKHKELNELNGNGLHLIFVAACKSTPLGKESKWNYKVTIHNRLTINNPVSKEMLTQNEDLWQWSPVKMNFRSVGQQKQFVDKNIAEELWRLILGINPDLKVGLSKIINQEPSPEPSIEGVEEPYHNGDDKIPFHLDQIESTDRLNREPIAKSLARLLNGQIFKENCKAKKKNKIGHSFMIHLQGAWGDGKSTFLNLLGNHLGSNLVIVDFNAWRHQHMDPPWWIFMDSIYKAIQGSKGHKFGIWWKERWWRLIRLNSLYWISFFAIIFVFMVVNIIFDFELLKFSSPKFDGKIISAITSYISIVGSIWLLIKSISKTLISASADAANEFKEKARDSMQELKKHHEEIINYTNNHVAVFIDDLDRCNATFAVELLEGIQTLFNDQPVLYVVAGDRYWLRTCFENYYQSYKGVAREPGQRLGYLFLEKAFQLSLRLPKVSGETKKEYWEFILNPQNKKIVHAEDSTRESKKEQVKSRISKDYSRTDFSNPQSMKKIIEEHELNFEEATDIVLEVMDSSSEDVKHLLKNHHHLIDANPRGIKRMANQYTVYRNILTAEGKNFDRDKLFRWLILQNKYPVYTDWLEENLIDYKKGKKLPDDLNILEEDERLKLLMYDEGNSKGGVMSPEDISLFTDIELHIENNETTGSKT